MLVLETYWESLACGGRPWVWATCRWSSCRGRSAWAGGPPRSSRRTAAAERRRARGVWRSSLAAAGSLPSEAALARSLLMLMPPMHAARLPVNTRQLPRHQLFPSREHTQCNMFASATPSSLWPQKAGWGRKVQPGEHYVIFVARSTTLDVRN
jgi:hypothetical protein